MDNVFDYIGEQIIQKIVFLSEVATTRESPVSGVAQSSSADVVFGVLSIFFVTVIMYSLVRIYEIRKEEKKKFNLADLF